MNTEDRNARILRSAKQGMSITRIAELNKLSRRQVGRIVLREQLMEHAIDAAKGNKSLKKRCPSPPALPAAPDKSTPFPTSGKGTKGKSIIEKQMKVTKTLSEKRDMAAKRKIEHDAKVAADEAKVLSILSTHVGSHKAIHMPDLYQRVYQKPWHDKITDTRQIRQIISDLRFKGVPICSKTDTKQGGYYLASAESELAAYLKNLKKRGLSALAMYSRIKKCVMNETLGQLMLEYK